MSINLLSTLDVCSLLIQELPEYERFLKNGFIDHTSEKCIGVFTAQSPDGFKMCVGGLECTQTNTLSTSIVVHWTQNRDECDKAASDIFGKLISLAGELQIGKHIIACVFLPDPNPIDVERDNNNICEAVIRANFVYYI